MIIVSFPHTLCRYLIYIIGTKEDISTSPFSLAIHLFYQSLIGRPSTFPAHMTPYNSDEASVRDHAFCKAPSSHEAISVGDFQGISL